MDYTLFDPPFKLDFIGMSQGEARAYFEWFVDHIPTRIAELQRAMESTDRVPLHLDLTIESLGRIGEWFQPYIKTRPRAQSELTKERDNMPGWFQGYVTGWTWTEETISLCVDIGIYYGETLRRIRQDARWDYVRGPSRDINLHQPVLKGLRKGLDLNPVQVVIAIAYRAYQGESASELLLKAAKSAESS